MSLWVYIRSCWKLDVLPSLTHCATISLLNDANPVAVRWLISPDIDIGCGSHFGITVNPKELSFSMKDMKDLPSSQQEAVLLQICSQRTPGWSASLLYWDCFHSWDI